ncbi:MAG: DUF3386 domain-containing protein [Calothrix sp. MO_192.B10]|nr:DUF3386 domain-containing protein [Calothrix sp. MO_192.B10]
MTDRATPQDLFQIAYESRYTWDEKFPGYTADVQLVQDSSVYTGKITIHSDLSVDVTDVADEQIKAGIYTQLQDIVTHRQRIAFSEAHGKHEFIFGDADEAGTVEILVRGDSMDSKYTIKNGEICHVRRVMGRMAVAIATYETLDTGSGYIATKYDATFSNANTNEINSVLKFTETYDKFGNYYLMIQQSIQEDQNGECSTTEFNYTNIQLI